jgi:hypothetical protein
MFLNQGTSQPQASQEEEKKVNGDMASWEELVELDDVQLATVAGGIQMNREPEPWFVELTLPYGNPDIIVWGY